MYWLLIGLIIGFLVFVVISIRKEKDIIGFYKAQGIFGRAYAFFAVEKGDFRNTIYSERDFSAYSDKVENAFEKWKN